MEVVDIKKLLAPNLLVYIYLHCVKSLSWCATTLATLLYIRVSWNWHFGFKISFSSNPLHWKTIKLPVDRKIVFEFSVNISQDGTHIIEVSFDDQNTYIQCSVLCYSYITLFDITTNVANFEIAFAICIIDIRFI